MTTPVKSASPRQGKIKVRSERVWVLKLISSIFFTFVVATTFAADGELSSRDAEHDYDPPVPGSYSLPVVKVAPDGAIIDSDSKSLRLRDLIHGRVAILSFIYTRCAAPKACPYATGVLSQLYRASERDSALAKNLRLVSLSFDPEYDTPQRLATYSEGVHEGTSGCEWRFTTAKSRADLKKILDAYGQAVDTRKDAADPQGPLYHILRVFLIDREGRIRNVYSAGTLDPRLVVADVKTLLLEQAKVSKQ
jgi:cytochrome oxidase Cu insertion factor (SCO1/SenC/PrrC family)